MGKYGASSNNNNCPHPRVSCGRRERLASLSVPRHEVANCAVCPKYKQDVTQNLCCKEENGTMTIFVMFSWREKNHSVDSTWKQRGRIGVLLLKNKYVACCGVDHWRKCTVCAVTRHCGGTETLGLGGGWGGGGFQDPVVCFEYLLSVVDG